MSHANAALTPKMRLKLARLVVDSRPLAARAYCLRDRGGTRVAALVRMGCALAVARLPDPPVDRVPPLLRLEHGPARSVPRGRQDELARAAARGDWDAFDSPLHALLVHQGGRCAL